MSKTNNKLNDLETFLMRCWDLFDKRMQEYGYTIRVHNDTCVGRGTLAFKNSDKWIPIIELHVWGSKDLSIHVKNRCGSFILNDGACIAIYQYVGNDMQSFENMIDYVVQKWGIYNKSNPYIFTSGEDETERKIFGKNKSNSKLNKDLTEDK